ncbi:MAG TPA: aldo/keto reductase [Acidimicrobiales bacterium]|nr:aldo/keto reductase [Acidimicrobiales bacterium]
MNYRHLGRSGLKVSPLCLGTMNFGPRTSEADSFVIMDKALETGINFFDTANRYGGTETESIIGRWFRQGGERREKVVLATKVYGAMSEWPNMSRLSARHIRDACEASLRRLQTDHIDLYQMHHIDRDTPWDEIWQAMDVLITQGKVIYIGSSNFAGWHVTACVEAARRRGSLGLVSEQSLYNLVARTVELELLPACQAYGVGVIPWSPLAGGLLGGVLDATSNGRRGDERIRRQAQSMRPQLEDWEKLCAELGEQPATVALAWLLAQPAVTAPIVGPRTVEQLTDSSRALDVALSDDVLTRLDALFPGPGGPAPEAYAW